MDAATRTFHETVLRLAKGIVRAYETWLRLQFSRSEPSYELPRPGATPQEQP